MDHHKPVIVTMETSQLTMVLLTTEPSIEEPLTAHWHQIHIGNRKKVQQIIIRMLLETTSSVGWGGINLTEIFFKTLRNLSKFKKKYYIKLVNVRIYRNRF